MPDAYAAAHEAERGFAAKTQMWQGEVGCNGKLPLNLVSVNFYVRA
jgi:hypothetical protein